MPGRGLLIGLLLLTGAFARAGAVDSICASYRPILVVDEFTLEGRPAYVAYPRGSATTDFDGDNREDGAHGDLVIATCRNTGKRCTAFNIPGEPDGDEIPRIYENLLAAIKSGTVAMPSAINLSARLLLEMNDVNKLALPRPITPANVGAERWNILRALLKDPGAESFYLRLYNVFTELNRLGVPLVTVAGNDGIAENFNFYSLMPGAITVGALDKAGRRASYSNDNTLVSVYRYGDLDGYSTRDGIDLNADGRAEFQWWQLSGRPANGLKTLALRGTSFAAPGLCGGAHFVPASNE